MPRPTYYTVVQHTGFAVGEDPDFEFAIEEAALNTAADVNKVTKVGGVLFNSYIEAIEYTDSEAYQDGNKGFIPKVPGTFSDQTIEGLKIYVPKRS